MLYHPYVIGTFRVSKYTRFLNNYNKLISTKLAQKFSDEQINLQKHFHKYSFASYRQI